MGEKEAGELGVPGGHSKVVIGSWLPWLSTGAHIAVLPSHL